MTDETTEKRIPFNPFIVEAWRSWDLQKLSDEYSPGTCVKDKTLFLDRYREDSQAVRETIPSYQDLAFGPKKTERLDFFPAQAVGNPPLMVFIHGGYWQRLSKDDGLFPAKGFVPSGVSYASVNYTLAPEASVEEITQECRMALIWLSNNAAELGFDRDRIFVSGSSAGGHLAVEMAVTDWQALGFEAPLIKGVVALSGVFDLRPLVHTYINDPLGMDEHAAAMASPAFHLKTACPLLAAWGENEPSEFGRQSRDLTAMWAETGEGAICYEVPGRNHFDLVWAMSDPDQQLFQDAMAMIGV